MRAVEGGSEAGRPGRGTAPLNAFDEEGDASVRSARAGGMRATSRGRTDGRVGWAGSYFLTLTRTDAVTAGMSGSWALSTRTT
jgi:hypothetical protein